MNAIPLRCFLSTRISLEGKPISRFFMIALIFLLSMTQPCAAATILLDPGHGGDDNGAIAGNAYFEKQFTLALAQATAHLLAPEHRIELTRTADVGPSITDRAGMANHLEADLMISLHAAVAPYCSDRRAAVYFHDDERLVFPPGTVAHSRIDGSDGDRPDWAKIQIRHQHQSRRLASSIKQSLLQEGTFDDISVSGVPLATLMGADLPAVLIEVGCMRQSMATSADEVEQEIGKFARPLAQAINMAAAGLPP